MIRYQAAADDDAFMRESGLELLVETARLWRSLGHHDANGRFRIDGVTGPDEYSALADNNVYTNLMAQQNLRAAADAVALHPRRAAELGADFEEAATWRDAAEDMVVPWDEALGVHPQSEGFTDHEIWDFESTARDQYPLLLHFPYFELYRKQVVKQADLVLALHARGDAFSDEEKARDFAYYEALTVRDSSLSACTQAVIAAEVGHLELAYDYFAEAALVDLHDLAGNTDNGVHIASLAGAWTAAVAGFGGMRDHGGVLTFAPRLPARLERLAFRLVFRGRRLKVDVTREKAAYTLVEGEPLEVGHHGETVTLSKEQPVALAVPPTPCSTARRVSPSAASRRGEGSTRRSLLIPERLGGPDARRAECRCKRRGQCNRVDDEEDDPEVQPGHDELEVLPARLRARVADDVPGEQQAESGSDDDRGESDEGRLEQECGLHHSRPESDCAHDADLLASLDDGSRTDDAERRHAHEQPQPHEALDQAVEGDVGGKGVVDDLLDRLRLQPAREECGLQPRGCVVGIDSRRELEVVDRRLDPTRECRREGLFRSRDADHLERRRVLEDADDGEPEALPRLLVQDLDRDRVEALLEVEAGELEVRKHSEVPAVPPGNDRAVHHGEARRLANRGPDVLLRPVAACDVA